jgi:basic membrane protein A and related proteins
MRRMRILAGISILALVLAACSSSTESDTAAPAEDTSAATEEVVALDDSNCASAEVFCIGLVTDIGKVDDKSFNQSAWEGAQAAAEQLGGFAKYVETVDTKDYANNIAQFTDKNYDAIVTVGFLMAEATVVAAQAYPDTHFIGVDQFIGEDIPNLTGLIFPEDQAGYAAGYLAGLMTTTNKLGQVLGMQIPPVEKFALGFEAGAKAANPAVSVTTVYHPPGDNAFTNPVWGGQEARKQLDQGADIIFSAGGATGNGGLIEIAKDSGAGSSIFCIGVDTDQWNTVPEAQPCLVTSAMKLITDGTVELLTAVFDGSIAGGNFVGQTGLAPYHDFDSSISADIKAKVAEIVAGLKDGSVQTGVTL